MIDKFYGLTQEKISSGLPKAKIAAHKASFNAMIAAIAESTEDPEEIPSVAYDSYDEVCNLLYDKLTDKLKEYNTYENLSSYDALTPTVIAELKALYSDDSPQSAYDKIAVFFKWVSRGYLRTSEKVSFKKSSENLNEIEGAYQNNPPSFILRLDSKDFRKELLRYLNDLALESFTFDRDSITDDLPSEILETTQLLQQQQMFLKNNTAFDTICYSDTAVRLLISNFLAENAVYFSGFDIYQHKDFIIFNEDMYKYMLDWGIGTHREILTSSEEKLITANISLDSDSEENFKTNLIITNDIIISNTHELVQNVLVSFMNFSEASTPLSTLLKINVNYVRSDSPYSINNLIILIEPNSLVIYKTELFDLIKNAINSVETIENPTNINVDVHFSAVTIQSESGETFTYYGVNTGGSLILSGLNTLADSSLQTEDCELDGMSLILEMSDESEAIISNNMDEIKISESTVNVDTVKSFLQNNNILHNFRRV